VKICNETTILYLYPSYAIIDMGGILDCPSPGCDNRLHAVRLGDYGRESRSDGAGPRTASVSLPGSSEWRIILYRISGNACRTRVGVSTMNLVLSSASIPGDVISPVTFEDIPGTCPEM